MTERLFLDELTYEEASRLEGAVALLPTGATEAHGPHLPLGTDVIISRTAAARACRRLRDEGVRAIVLIDVLSASLATTLISPPDGSATAMPMWMRL